MTYWFNSSETGSKIYTCLLNYHTIGGIYVVGLGIYMFFFCKITMLLSKSLYWDEIV